jgi:hypothetical protein
MTENEISKIYVFRELAESAQGSRSWIIGVPRRMLIL